MTRPSAVLDRANGTQNKLLPQDRAAHDWYRFVLSFPPHLVREYLERLGMGRMKTVLDPFCGTGTTLVECAKLGVCSFGIEANPMAFHASKVKTDWTPDPDQLIRHATQVAESALAQLRADGIEDEFFASSAPARDVRLRVLPPEQEALLLAGSISPLPLHKTLALLEAMDKARDERFVHHERLALAKALVLHIGNLHFGPEVGVGPAKKDVAVIPAWLDGIHAMAGDLRYLQTLERGPVTVLDADSRDAGRLLPPESIDAVITSPPYPNEKDYTRTTRLESVLLGFVRDKASLRRLKMGLVRSNTRNVYVADQDHEWVAEHAGIQRLAREIEERRIELGKTSGFERLYARVTRLYFGGMARHLAGLRPALRPGAQLAYVVGDQASYFRVLIRTGSILAEIAESLGYEVTGTDLFRTRLATSTREQLREEVVRLRWPGQPQARPVSVKERPAPYGRKRARKMRKKR